jgi:hypothetical protein
MSWEDTLSNWSKGPCSSEEEKGRNAERVICDALNNDSALSPMNILVFSQGSYKARTNVRLDSDVDICILNRDYVFDEYPGGITRKDVGITDSNFTYFEFKNMVEKALVARFGSGVKRGNKAFDVHANTYRLDADVVPAFEHRRYTNNRDYNGNYLYYKGIEFISDNGFRIINWPDQTFDNGKEKHENTNRRYKKAIRILKRLRNSMQEKNILAAKDIGSFVIESMVWNVPDSEFNTSNYKDMMQNVLAYLYIETLSKEKCEEWGEVNELKYLFKNDEDKRTRANNFIYAAWEHIGFN